jgi:hypothetical protein
VQSVAGAVEQSTWRKHEVTAVIPIRNFDQQSGEAYNEKVTEIELTTRNLEHASTANSKDILVNFDFDGAT